MLSAQHLVKSFAGRRVIEDVTLTLHRGEIVGLLGPNGAGKTTTFQLLTGMSAPDGGSILLDGIDVTDMPFYDRARFGISLSAPGALRAAQPFRRGQYHAGAGSPHG